MAHSVVGRMFCRQRSRRAHGCLRFPALPSALLAYVVAVSTGCGGRSGGTGEPGTQAQALRVTETFAPCGTSAGGAQCVVKTSDYGAGSVVYEISLPVVNQPNTLYPMITFKPGDHVLIRADGCVQTGGAGSTWKRYVNPLGDVLHPVTGLYHGTITIPGVTGVADHIAAWVEKAIVLLPGGAVQYTRGVFQIPPTLPAPVSLQLGYVDDDYSDNGYYAHDDGTFDQCKGENGTPAHLAIFVNLATAPRPAIPFPYDLVADTVDANLLDFNTRWAWQVPNTYPFPVPSYDGADLLHMTSQTTSWDEGPQLFGATCPGRHGHRNWRDATYTGTLNWVEHSGGLFGDDDYNVFIRPPYVAGTPFVAGGLADRPDRILMEFDSDETVDHFGDGQPTWWTLLHRAVDWLGDDYVRYLMDGKDAIAVGLVGIDEVHNSTSQTGNEIHPVHALAIRVQSQLVSGYVKEWWAVFVRNWGNEGFCGKQQHYLNLSNITLRLPPSNPAVVDLAGTGSAPTDENLFTNMNSIGGFWRQAPSSAVAPAWTYTFQLAPPTVTVGNQTYQVGHWIAGDVVVRWKLLPGAQVAAAPFFSLAPLTAPVASSPREPFAWAAPLAGAPSTVNPNIATSSATYPDVGGDADGTEPLWNMLTPAQQAVAQSVYPAIAPQRPRLPWYPATLMPGPPPPPPSQPPTVSEGPPLPQAVGRQNAIVSTICIAVDQQFPGAPGACAQAAPATMLSTTGGMPGKNGWLVSPVTATLNPRSASGAGIAYTEYGYDPASLARYAGPFVLPEGEVALLYRSADVAGNIEDLRRREFRIDTRPPTAQASASLDATGVAFAYSVSDPIPGSGPAGIHTAALDASYNPLVHQFTPGASGTIHLDSVCTAVEYWGEDVAGNEQTPHSITPDANPPSLDVSPSLCISQSPYERVALRLGRELPAAAKDGCDPVPTVRIVSVTSNERDDERHENESPEDVTFGPSTVCVELDGEREARAHGRPRKRSFVASTFERVYTVIIEARDASGNTTRKQTLIQIPDGDEQAIAGCGPIGTPIPEEVPCE